MRNLLCYGLVAALAGGVAFAQAPQFRLLTPMSVGLRSPARLALNSDGNLLVSDPARGRVEVLDASGRLVESHAGLGSPLALAVDSAGGIYISDQKLGAVSVYDAGWNLVKKLGNGDHEFGLAGALALSSDSSPTVYVCDSIRNQVKAYQSGTLAFLFGSYGTNQGQFDFPCALFLSAHSELFVLDQNNDRVQVFDPKGNYLRQFTLATYDTGGMFAPRRSGRALGLIGDASGRIYVADGFQGRVQVFDGQGAFLGSIAGTEAVPFRTPSGMLVDRNNRLLVALANSGSVAVVGLENYLGVTVVPSSRVVPAGTTVTFTANAGADSPLYQWRKGQVNLSDGGNLAGATRPQLRLTAVTPADSGQYSVLINGGPAALASPDCLLTVLNPPVIISGPTNQTAVQNTPVNFTAVAEGDSLAYQWRFDGNDVPNATSSTLELPRVTSANAGRYQVKVSNAVGAAFSDSATLDVVIPPAPPVLQPLTFGTNSLAALTILVAPNQSYTIETSTDLHDWVTLTNVFNDTGTIELTGLSAASPGRQFYRVRWTQP